MKEMHFSIDIQATKQTVWDTLWRDETFRDWAGMIDPGTYMKGELKEGGVVEFISSENGYGVTSLVEECVANELLLLRHHADTQDSGERGREDQWTGGKESYKLVENDGVTTLTAMFDVPEELEKLFEDIYPKALQRVKVLAEQG